jgi:itaconate CoA-transferase
VQVLEQPELADDPRFATNAARTANRELTDAVVGQVLARLTGEDAVAGLDAAGIACARLNSVADVVAHPQPAARDRWREVESPAGPLRALLPPITLPGGVEARMGAVPALGNTPTQLCGPWG